MSVARNSNTGPYGIPLIPQIQRVSNMPHQYGVTPRGQSLNTNNTIQTPHFPAIPQIPQHIQTPQYPGFTPMGDGISLSLMSDDIKHLNKEEMEMWRSVMTKCGIFNASLVTINIKQYRDFSNKHPVIRMPPKKQEPAATKPTEAEDITLGVVVPKTVSKQLKQEKKEETKMKVNNKICSTQWTEDEFEKLLKEVVTERSVSDRKLHITENQAVELQNLLFYNDICTLGADYNIITNEGKRYPSIQRNILNMGKGKKRYKVLSKTKAMDVKVYKLWCKYTKEYNEMNEKQEIEENESKEGVQNKKRNNNMTSNDNAPPHKKAKVSET